MWKCQQQAVNYIIHIAHLTTMTNGAKSKQESQVSK